MNGEIKFRIWDVKQKVMRYLVNADCDGYTLGFTTRGHIDIGSCSEGYMSNGQLERYAIQQYTGLVDVKGNDIYAGDIVKLSLSFEDKGRIVKTKDFGFNSVIYDLNQVKFRLKDMVVVNPNWLENDLTHFDCEVVGNIFENGDLLK